MIVTWIRLEPRVNKNLIEKRVRTDARKFKFIQIIQKITKRGLFKQEFFSVHLQIFPQPYS